MKKDEESHKMLSTVTKKLESLHLKNKKQKSWHHISADFNQLKDQCYWLLIFFIFALK